MLSSTPFFELLSKKKTINILQYIFFDGGEVRVHDLMDAVGVDKHFLERLSKYSFINIFNFDEDGEFESSYIDLNPLLIDFFNKSHGGGYAGDDSTPIFAIWNQIINLMHQMDSEPDMLQKKELMIQIERHYRQFAAQLKHTLINFREKVDSKLQTNESLERKIIQLTQLREDIEKLQQFYKETYGESKYMLLSKVHKYDNGRIESINGNIVRLRLHTKFIELLDRCITNLQTIKTEYQSEFEKCLNWFSESILKSREMDYETYYTTIKENGFSSFNNPNQKNVVSRVNLDRLNEDTFEVYLNELKELGDLEIRTKEEKELKYPDEAEQEKVKKHALGIYKKIYEGFKSALDKSIWYFIKTKLSDPLFVKEHEIMFRNQDSYMIYIFLLISCNYGKELNRTQDPVVHTKANGDRVEIYDLEKI